MKNIIFVLICCVLLTGCGPLQEVVQPAVVATQPVLPTQTTAPISTFTPIPTFTPYHTNTPLPTYTPYTPPTATTKPQVQQPTTAYVPPANTPVAPPADEPEDTPVPPPADNGDDEEPLERDMNLSVSSHCPDAHRVTFYGPVTEVFQVPANGYVSKQLPSGRYYYSYDDDPTRYGPQDLYSTWWELEICPQN